MAKYGRMYTIKVHNNGYTMVTYRYNIINKAYEIVATFLLEEDALTYVETHRQYSYVREIAPTKSNLQRLWDIS